MTHSQQARLGIKVECFDSEHREHEYRMFHCRQRDQGDEKRCSIEDWMRDVVSCFPYFGDLPGVKTMKPGEVRRYWVHLRVTGTQDYWGDYDEDVDLLKVRRIK